MMGKTLMTMEGIGRQIYPELDLVEVAKPHFLKLLEDRYSPEKISGELIRVVARLSTAASTVPVHAQEILDNIRKGDLSLEIRVPNLILAADRLGVRISIGLIVAALIISSAALFATEHLYFGAGMLAAAGASMLLQRLALSPRANTRTKR
jgi:ubiquinone biosynthesis protein